MSLFPDPAPSVLPRDTDWIYAHCDGGSRGNPGPAGFVAVITDTAGTRIAELSEFLGIRTNNFAEYSGLLAVLTWAIEHGHRRLKVVSDSELMVKQIQGKYKINSPDLKPLWQLARDRIEKFDDFEIAHALRDKNKAADALANRAMDRGTRRVVETVVVDVAALPPLPDTSPEDPQPIEPAEPIAHPGRPVMLRGVSRGGVIQLLGGATLRDGIFVKVIPE